MYAFSECTPKKDRRFFETQVCHQGQTAIKFAIKEDETRSTMYSFGLPITLDGTVPVRYAAGIEIREQRAVLV